MSWKKGGYQKSVHKIQDEVTGEEAAILLADLVDGNKMKMHKYNIYRQLSELKCLKMSLKEDEVILSVDFSKDYENRHHHEIQSAYFGHRNFAIFTAPFSLLEWWLCWPVPVSIRVSFFLLLSSQPWELGKMRQQFYFYYCYHKGQIWQHYNGKIFKHGNYLKYLLIFCFLLLDCFYTCLFIFYLCCKSYYFINHKYIIWP